MNSSSSLLSPHRNRYLSSIQSSTQPLGAIGLDNKKNNSFHGSDGSLEVTVCNQQGAKLPLYSQSFPFSSSTHTFYYLTLSITFSQSSYSITPKSKPVPLYIVELNSTSRLYPNLTSSSSSLQSNIYYDYDVALSGTFHPSYLLNNNNNNGNDIYLSLFQQNGNNEEIFDGTIYHVAMYDRVMFNIYSVVALS